MYIFNNISLNSRSILLRIINVSDKVVGKIKTHFVFNKFYSKIVQSMT